MPARSLTLVLALVALALLACSPSVAALWELWRLNPYSDGHGPLIAAISFWLIVRSRHALATTPLRPSGGGAALLVACSLAWVIAWRAAAQDLHVMLLPLLLFAILLAALGPRAARIVAFPLGYLYFAEPMWHVLTSPLQTLTIDTVGVIAPLLGMPVTTAGNILSFPGNIRFEVTPICSGVNFLVVGLAAAALIGELQQASLRRRAGLLASMAPLMILSNWTRVLAIIVAGYSSGMRSVLATRGHWYLGWVIFALVMLGFAHFAARGSGPPAPALGGRSTQ